MSSSDVGPKSLPVYHSDHPYSTEGLVVTVVISAVMFIFIVLAFEIGRYYKQIFLKRLQQRFIDTGRVPPEPPDSFLGWLTQICKVPERGMSVFVCFPCLRFALQRCSIWWDWMHICF
jgi:hypothetical protein